MSTEQTNGVPPHLARAALLVLLAAAAVAGCSCEKPIPRPVPGITAGMPLVRVKLGDDVATLDVAITGPWSLAGPSGELARSQSLEWTTVSIASGAVKFGDLAPVEGPIELRPEGDGAVWLKATVGGNARERCYRGVVRISPTAERMLRVINVLPMESYLAGVLANELIKSWHTEAYKAQCIAARTFALQERNSRTRYDFDVYDTTQSQVYGGAGTETDKAWEAVRDTWGIVATMKNPGPGGKTVLLKTYYHSTCGGDTVPAGVVFGGQTPKPLSGGTKCTYCRNSPKFHWPEVVISKKDLTDALARGGGALARLGRVQQVEVAERVSDGGRAKSIRVIGSSGLSLLVSAGHWRILAGPRRIPSTWFDIEDRGDSISLVNGRGYGHGVGLCQWGAEYLARHGQKGEQILRYYYPGVELVRTY